MRTRETLHKGPLLVKIIYPSNDLGLTGESLSNVTRYGINQLMVDCWFWGRRWFGFLESPYERDYYLGVPLESQTTNPNQQSTKS